MARDKIEEQRRHSVDEGNQMAVQEVPNQLFRVVLADDNREMRDTVTRLLGSEFVLVGAVADGRALVDAVSELKPDIGIVDISMPIMNGIDAVAEILRCGSEMKIVFLTVNEDNDFVRAAFETGANAYVVKRQMASDLPIALKKALAGHKFVSPGCDLSEFD